VAPDYVAGLRAPTRPLSFATIRNVETIASELRLIAAVRRTAAEIGAPMPPHCTPGGSVGCSGVMSSRYIWLNE
jgi:hypothetical protein